MVGHVSPPADAPSFALLTAVVSTGATVAYDLHVADAWQRRSSTNAWIIAVAQGVVAFEAEHR